MKLGLKIILIITGFILFFGLGATYYVFNKPHRNIAKERPAFIMEASELFEEFNMNEDLGNKKFGNQVIQVSGKVTEIPMDENGISFILNNSMEAVNCTIDVQYEDKVKKIKLGGKVTLKGKCDGFDMIMGVVLIKCILIEKK